MRPGEIYGARASIFISGVGKDDQARDQKPCFSNSWKLPLAMAGRHPHSSANNLVAIDSVPVPPHHWLPTVDDRAYPVAAARVWNSLLDLVTCAPSVAVFRSLYRQQITLTVQCSWKLQKVKQTGYQQLGVRVLLSVADTKHNSPSPHPASVLSAAVHGSFSALREATDRTSSSWKTVSAISILSQSSWHPCATTRKGL